jgi:hypothetical protein
MFCLPLRRAQLEVSFTSACSETFAGSDTILVIEDEKEMRKIIILVLERAGFEML